MNHENLSIEERKMLLEIKHLEKKWYSKPSYLTVVVAILSSVFSVFITYNSNVFDLKLRENKVLRQELEWDIKRFTEDKKRLTTDIEVYREIVKNDSIIKVKFESIAMDFLKEISKNENTSIPQINNFNESIDSIYFYVEKNFSLRNTISKLTDNYLQQRLKRQ